MRVLVAILVLVFAGASALWGGVGTGRGTGHEPGGVCAGEAPSGSSCCCCCPLSGDGCSGVGRAGQARAEAENDRCGCRCPTGPRHPVRSQAPASGGEPVARLFPAAVGVAMALPEASGPGAGWARRAVCPGLMGLESSHRLCVWRT
ncbi:MAG: hypothetical protein SFY69_01950 [Planctomycetota bacterium]|nr:hypothetical protein [Planctomycetota bacterium]